MNWRKSAAAQMLAAGRMEKEVDVAAAQSEFYKVGWVGAVAKRTPNCGVPKIIK